MAFTARNLSILAYANGFTLWHYKSDADPADDIRREGYFAAAQLAAGDMMLLSGAWGGRLMCVTGTGDDVVLAPMG